MLGKGCLIVMLLGILAVLGSCGVMFFQQCNKKAPTVNEARYIVQVVDSEGMVMNEFLTNYVDKDGETTILRNHYTWDGEQWVYHDRPLKITQKWGKVAIQERR